MPSDVSVRIYKYEELSDKKGLHGSRSPRDKARDWWIEVVGHEHTLEVHRHFIEQLGTMGYPTEQIEFSLGCCQGDGMAFYTGKLRDPKDRTRAPFSWSNPDHVSAYVDTRRLWRTRLRNRFKKDFRRRLYSYVHRGLTIDVGINRNSYASSYSHFNTMWVDIEYDYNTDAIPESERAQLDKDMASLKETLADDVKDVSKMLEAEGYKLLEDQASEDIIKEDLEANNIRFYADGRPFREEDEVGLQRWAALNSTFC